MRTQRGAVGLMLVLLMVLTLVIVLATYVLTRITGAREELVVTQDRVARAAEALEQFAATTRRLPCPAAPTLDDGLASPDAATAACNFPQGTLPWRTLGLAREAGYDGWNRKLSYRVGTFIAADAVNMFHCDLADGAPGGTVAGLCRQSNDPYQRNTTLAQFIAGKGLTLADFASNYTDVAYAVISHGATGLGAYTVSGARLDLPVGNERNNALAGPYAIAAFSNPDVGATAAAHYDDVLAYRRIDDLGKRIGLAARDWPEGASFNQATLAAATGSGTYRDNVGGNFSFMGNAYRATGGLNTFSFTTAGGAEGIGIAGGGNNLINDNEVVRIDLALAAGRVAFTLAHFGTVSSSTFRERVLVRFYNSSGVVIGSTMTRHGCRADGGLATFVVDSPDPGTTSQRVELEGESVSGTFGFVSSAFLLSELAACGSSAACTTGLASVDNLCTNARLTGWALSPTTVTRPAASTLTFTVQAGTDNAGQDGLAIVGSLPAGLAFANTLVGGSCGGGPVLTVTASSPVVAYKITRIAIGNGAESCTVALSVSSTDAGSYTLPPELVTSTANLTKEIASSIALTVE